MTILEWNEGSCPKPGSGTPPRPYGTCCYKYADGTWLKQADNATNGGVCDPPNEQGDYEDTYVLVECRAPDEGT
jgi:hypothetical protein